MKIIFAKGRDKTLNAEMQEFIKSLNFKYEAKNIKMEFLPSFIIKNGDHEIVYSFVPKGLEYDVLIRTLEKMEEGRVELSENTKKLLRSFKKNVEIKVFVSPLCHYCPRVVEKLNELVVFNANIKTWVIDAFSYNVKKYNILSLPWIVINGKPYLSRKFSEEELAFGITKSFQDKDFYRDAIMEGSAIELGKMINSKEDAIMVAELLEDEEIKVRMGSILALEEIKDKEILKAVKEKLEEMLARQGKDDIRYALEEIFFNLKA